jgi:hypothetical protein
LTNLDAVADLSQLTEHAGECRRGDVPNRPFDEMIGAPKD